MKLFRSHNDWLTVVIKQGRRLQQRVPIFRTDWNEQKTESPSREARLKEQKPEIAEARKKAAVEKRLRKQRKQRGDLK